MSLEGVRGAQPKEMVEEEQLSDDEFKQYEQ